MQSIKINSIFVEIEPASRSRTISNLQNITSEIEGAINFKIICFPDYAV